MLWTAQFVSNIGTWMQTVGAQWFLVGASGSPTLVALVQTASSLPILLLALPAGVLADLVDRRRLLLYAQVAMALVAALLAVASMTEELTPLRVLIATFALGVGVAASTPAWQAVQPDVVSRELLPTAAALSGASINIGRAAGPALGGVVVAIAGPGWTFALNAVSFLVVAGALVRWRTPRSPRTVRELLRAAMRTGVSYTRHSPPVRRLVIRAGLWTAPASVLWALLPVISHTELRLGSAGYGLLLASVGVGAFLGAVVLAPLRHRIAVNRLLTLSGVGYSVSLLGIGAFASVPVVLALLMIAGGCWIAVLSTLNAAAQVLLPRWVRARGIGVFVLVLQGGQAIGATLWGTVAERTSASAAFLAAGVALLLVTLAARRLRLDPPVTPERGHPIAWMAPSLRGDVAPGSGPVLVRVDYHVRPDQVPSFVESMPEVRAVRLRGGARNWSCAPDPMDGTTFRERFVVATSHEAHELNEARLTADDHALLRRLATYTAEQPTALFELGGRPGPAAASRSDNGRS